MSTRHLSAGSIRRALDTRDLTDPAQGPHAVHYVMDEIEGALTRAWGVPLRRRRAHPVVSVRENYDRLLVPPDAVSRDARYTRYLNDDTVLRTMTSVLVPPLLEELAASSTPEPDVLLSCPGLVYRRDCIDRRHVGEPHQLDLWRIRTAGAPMAEPDLCEMIELVVGAALPGARWRTVPADHPYTTGGREIYATRGMEWIEVGECGLANPALLASCGLPVPPSSGLAMGLGLDRLVMLRKGIDDIRLLRSTDPRVSSQMHDLSRYRPVSSMPPVRRDLSIAVAAETTAEELGDHVRAALGPDAASVEEAHVLTETPYAQLPEQARSRLGIDPTQKNVLVRIVLRDLDRTLTDQEANGLRDRIYAALHQGTAHQWAGGGGAGVIRASCGA